MTRWWAYDGIISDGAAILAAALETNGTFERTPSPMARWRA